MIAKGWFESSRGSRDHRRLTIIFGLFAEARAKYVPKRQVSTVLGDGGRGKSDGETDEVFQGTYLNPMALTIRA
jgi:hypothetical protein